jgi:hypothetical protein
MISYGGPCHGKLMEAELRSNIMADYANYTCVKTNKTSFDMRLFLMATGCSLSVYACRTYPTLQHSRFHAGQAVTLKFDYPVVRVMHLGKK